MILSILISTLNEGINNIQNILLPCRQDVNYLVVHNYTDKTYSTVPVKLLRKDVVVHQVSGRGLTKARNFGILKAKGDIALIADDDVTYTNEYFDVILKTFTQDNPDVAIFKIKTMTGESNYKNYPDKPYQLSMSNLHSPSSIEIAFKIHSIRNKIKFDERFGLGTFLNGGEEDIFILDVLKNGLIVKYFPFYVVNHHEESTIKTIPMYHKKRAIVRGAYIARIYGWLALPYILIKSLTLIPALFKANKNPLVYIYEMYLGCFYILFNIAS